MKLVDLPIYSLKISSEITISTEFWVNSQVIYTVDVAKR